VLPPLLLAKQGVHFHLSYKQGFAQLCSRLGIAADNVDEFAPTQIRRRITADEDPFCSDLFTGRRRSVQVKVYFFHKLEPTRMSILTAIIKNKIGIRLGITIYPNDKLTTGEILRDVDRELRANKHMVSGIVTVQKSASNSSEFNFFTLPDGDLVNVAVASWYVSDGGEAIAQVVEMLFEVIQNPGTYENVVKEHN
jgi:hypothetical protein